MRLSEAIRLGAMVHDKAVGFLAVFAEPGSDTVTHTCAIGAACVGQGVPFSGINVETMVAQFPILNVLATGPAYACQVPVFMSIVKLNDILGWSREQIADWVEEVEIHLPAIVEMNPWGAVGSLDRNVLKTCERTQGCAIVVDALLEPAPQPVLVGV